MIRLILPAAVLTAAAVCLFLSLDSPKPPSEPPPAFGVRNIATPSDSTTITVGGKPVRDFAAIVTGLTAVAQVWLSIVQWRQQQRDSK